MANNLLAGTAYVTLDGVSYDIAGAGTYTVSSVERETLKGQSGIHGVKEMPAPGKIGWTGRDSGKVSIAALDAATDVTVVLQLANGKTIVGRNMWRVGEPIEVDTEEATFTIAFEGPDVTEA